MTRGSAHGRGDRWKTEGILSDRLHVIPGKCDYTAGWTLLFTSDPQTPHG